MHKSYLINKINFSLKSDLTLDEAEEVQELFQNLFIKSEQINGQSGSPAGLVTGSFSNAEIKRFLSIVLEPATMPGAIEEKPNIDFGRVKESVAVEVIKDFFLNRIKKYQDFFYTYSDSISQQ